MRDSIIAINVIIQINHYLASNRPGVSVTQPIFTEQESLILLMTEQTKSIKEHMKLHDIRTTPFY